MIPPAQPSPWLTTACPCPLCGSRSLAELPLMEAVSCQACEHIFVPTSDRPGLELVDTATPFTWRWTGCAWQRQSQGLTTVNWLYAPLALGFVVLPTSLVATGAYLFPPLPGSPLAWLPSAWVVATAVAHLACLLWLSLEVYQFPLRIYLQAWGRRWRRGASSVVNP